MNFAMRSGNTKGYPTRKVLASLSLSLPFGYTIRARYEDDVLSRKRGTRIRVTIRVRVRLVLVVAYVIKCCAECKACIISTINVVYKTVYIISTEKT